MLVVALLASVMLRSAPPSEREVLAAVSPAVALIAHVVKVQVFIDGEKVREERGYVVSSGTVVKSDRTGSHLLTIAHGIDLTYLEEELNTVQARLGFRVGFRTDTEIRDLHSVVREMSSHYADRRLTVKLIWKKELRADFQWEQIFKIPARAVLLDSHKTGMDLALVYVPARNVPVVPIGDSRGLRAGETVLDFGNPLGVFGVPERGIAAVPQERNYEAPAWRRLYTFSLPSFPGMSGSAILNARGEIVGILKAAPARTLPLGSRPT